ncbi:hypothetical protein chiPu_0011524 [Chiloscyllium punctatum]|uniref:Uncharacterized protein n=1 Tax=Chiloscyllium punctatum TaxID=137246 RepID=A0A401SRN9_CHIPU|nr:hypothetical protein [Chiloscyllium punctatum]
MERNRGMGDTMRDREGYYLCLALGQRQTESERASPSCCIYRINTGGNTSCKHHCRLEQEIHSWFNILTPHTRCQPEVEKRR